MAESRQTTTRPATTRFEQLAAWSYGHRWWAMAFWVAVLAGVTLASQAIGSNFRNDFSLPGTESQRVLDTLKQHAPAQAGPTVQVVLQDPEGLRQSPTRERVEATLGELRGLPRVAEVRSPYADAAAISRDGTTGYATVTLDGQAESMLSTEVRRIIDTARGAGGDGLRVELGGEAVRSAEAPEGGVAEGVGLLAALVVLVLLFGSLLSPSLPIVIAVFAVGSSIGLIVLASHLATVAEFTPPTVILVGLGVGIDYALLVFSRFRAELVAGADREQAARRALDTAGRTVLFAGGTVIIALTGLVALGLGSLQGVAVAVALTVLVTMLASLTLLPALLAIVGGRIERAAHRRSERARDATGSRWRWWAAVVQRRPWPAALLGVSALLAVSAPVLGLHLGLADAGNDPTSTTSRRAYDTLARGFGPGFNGPLVVVAEGGNGAAAALQHTLEATAGVAATTPPVTAPGGQVTTVIVFPESKPQDARTKELVTRLREEVLPPLERATGATLLVGGTTAATVDFADAVASRLPLFVTVVVGLSAVLLLVIFHSLLIPLKAALLNVLSVGAALGAITLVFQQGILSGPLGVEPGPIEAFVPVMIFAIAFGLSMDYEVFLLSRMQEEWNEAHDAAGAIREGLATTGRVVTAAAAIMIVVFASFMFDPGRLLKQFGLGLAAAVFLDALVIRCLIVPAVMQLLGPKAWWLPNWVGQRIPRLALERGRGSPARDARSTTH